MKKTKMQPLVIAVGAAVFVTLLWIAGLLQGWENRTIDYRFLMRGPQTPSSDVVIVAADEGSIKSLGRWPWPRSTHAKLIRLLTAAGARAVVFDILFTEPDLEHPDADQTLAAASRVSGKVVHASFFQMAQGAPVDPLMPIPAIRESALVGFTNIFPELDGVARKIPLFLPYEKTQVPSLVMQALQIYYGKPAAQIVAEKHIPLTDDYHEMQINYAGGYESFKYYSYDQVIAGAIPASDFAGKIVLVGGTAAALFDLKAIPFSPMYPGVEVHANALSNIMRGDFLREPSALLTLALIVGFALLVGLSLSGLAPLYGALTCLGVFVGYYVAAYWLFVAAHLNVETAAPLLSLVLSYMSVILYRFMTEEREKMKIKNTFGHYLNRQLMEKVLNDPGLLKLGGDRKNLTVLFSDIRGFTTISESMKPDEIVPLLNEYLSQMVEVVFRNDGTLDKFIGDAVMAFWGAPVPDEEHPKKAVRCAIEMIEELKKLQEKWRQEGKPVIEIGIGVNTGDMVVGNLGSKQKMEYTVIGDNVNLGSRLEGLNKEYHTQIIISEATFSKVADIVEARPLGCVKVKGKTKEVTIYQVLGRKGAVAAPHGHFDPDARVTIGK